MTSSAALVELEEKSARPPLFPQVNFFLSCSAYDFSEKETAGIAKIESFLEKGDRCTFFIRANVTFPISISKAISSFSLDLSSS